MATEQSEQTPNDSPKPKRARKPAVRKPRVQAAPVAADSVPTGSPVSQGEFIGAVKEIIAASRAPEKITVANRIAHNPMNPDNTERHFAKPFFQNFDKIDCEDVTPLEYELIPQLKAGLFIKSRRGIPLVEVIIVKRGTWRGIHLRYDNSQKDKAMELQTYAPSLEVMLQKCINEYKAQQEVLAKRRAAGLPDEEDED